MNVDHKTLTPLPSSGPLLPPEAARSAPPPVQADRLGRYLMLERIGAGGMGVVYKAFDPQLERVVALKVVKVDGSPRVEASERLLREAKALARISHPNVVPVYDGGIVGHQVFIAMECVEGRTLRQWQAERRRTVGEVLQVYALAGRGLASAHQAALVHRDFKPGNVMVAMDGRVLVLDFGLVREVWAPSALAPAESLTAPENGVETATGTVLGTPAYMAPEQARGEAADARTDQFAFCVALYEALYGFRPEPEEGPVVAPRRAQPSGARGPIPRRVRRALLRGLSVDREARFPAMSSLLEQLRPGVPRPAAAAVGVALAAAVAGAVSLAGRPRPCLGFEARLTGAWDAPVRDEIAARWSRLPIPHAAETWRRTAAVLDRYAREWISRREQVCEATQIRREQSAELMDLRMQCLDQRLAELRSFARLLTSSDGDTAGRALEGAHSLSDLQGCAEGAEMLTRLPPPRGPGQREELAALREKLGEGQALFHAGKFRESLAQASAVVERARKLAYPPVLAESLLLAGLSHLRLEQLDQAGAAFTEAVEEAEAGREDGLRFEIGLGLLRMKTIQRRGAEELSQSEKELRGLERRLGPSDQREGDLVHALALVEIELGRYRSAQALAERVAEIRRRAGPAGEPALARALHTVGVTLERQGQYGEALAILEVAQSTAAKSLGTQHPGLSIYWNQRGSLLNQMGRYAEAEAAQRQALALDEAAYGPQHSSVARALNNLGNALRRQGRAQEAEPLLVRALKIHRHLSGERSVWAASTMLNVAIVHRQLKRLEEAEAEIRLSIDILREHPEHRGAELPNTLTFLGLLLKQRRALPEALQVLNEAVDEAEQRLGKDNPRIGWMLTHLGEVLELSGRPREAVPVLERALSLAERGHVAPVELADVRFILGRAVAGAGGDLRRARALAQRAKAAYEGLPPAAEGAEELRKVQRWLAAHR